MATTTHQSLLHPEQPHLVESYLAMRDDRDCGLDRITRQRLHIQQLRAALQALVDAFEAQPPQPHATTALEQARTLLAQRR